MVILGVDPGTATTGYGVVAENAGRVAVLTQGVVRTSPRHASGQRLLTIRDVLRGLLEEYRPDRAVVERLYFKRNVTSALKVGEARGVILLTLAEAGVPVLEFTPAEIKMAVTGYGGADKQQMTRTVAMLLGAQPRLDDAADALAAAICGLMEARLRPVFGG